MKSSFIFGTVAAVVFWAPGGLAKTPEEVEQIARAVSVEIVTGTGSGTIIHRQGNLYTIITNRHVVCTRKTLCSDRELRSALQLKTADGVVHQVSKSAIKLLKDEAGKPLDLAIVQFRSNKNYSVAQVADPGSLKVDDTVHTAGFPENRGWLFGTGQAQAVVNRRLPSNRDNGGYTVIYDAETLPGMSGGGAFDQNGRLVAVHGVGDQYTENTEAEVGSLNTAKAEVGNKIGYNRGIPIRWVVQSLEQQGILLGGRQLSSQTRTTDRAATADEFFIAGFNKLVNPGDDFQAGRKEALAQFDQAVAIKPRYPIAYFMRAYVKDLINDFLGAVADYDQAITLNPKFTIAYNNRGILKRNQLNDFQGALADYNKAISLDPNYLNAYYNRGNLKKDNLNDSQGALADYNKAIALAPKYAAAYNNRGNLKKDKLNDPQGALADYNKTISLAPNNAIAYHNRGLLKKDKLNDFQGALVDYNKAISLDPNYADAYNNRGILKRSKLNDPQGALVDFNKAISLDPNNANTYYNRGLLKKNSFGDVPGAIADFRQAAKLYREQGRTDALQNALDRLRSLGASE
jgi:tetratricopeptide (TPR) repeat protein/V8-like Glu-specific endopeptidase